MRTALALALSLMPLSTFAGATSQLSVSVLVIGRTILTIDRQPETIEISRADLARGYIDIPDAIAFRVRSNSAHGYRIVCDPIGEPFVRADIRWDEAVIAIARTAAWFARPYEPGTRSAVVGVRLWLGPDVVPDTYLWPIHISAESK